jgi:hypothetical protein
VLRIGFVANLLTSARKVIEKLEFFGYLWSPTVDTEYKWDNR